MAAAPRKNVIRETSDPGDLIILLGGRTGRDGCGGATGSSKVHTEASIETCGAEVQLSLIHIYIQLCGSRTRRMKWILLQRKKSSAGN